MKQYDEPFTTPYYDELKRNGIKLQCFLTHIRTDQAMIEKPKDARDSGSSFSRHGLTEYVEH